MLKRHGLVAERRRRGAVFRVERGTLTTPEGPNHVLGVDFKGWFLTGDGKRCDPLTVTDLHSRFILKIEGLEKARTSFAKAAFCALFRRLGIPEIIRVDTGAPFASQGPGGLSKLSVWWIGLGSEIQFSRPACPQDNGCHERMHRTMKAECCRPPSVNGVAQQQRFDRWRKDFNEERPHEGLGMRMPADVYHPSAKRLDERVKPRLYPLGTEIRRVDAAGFIGLEGGRGYVGEAFIGVDVALERSETSNLILVRYANVKLGQLGHLRETQTASGLLRQELGNQADQAARELMARSANFLALHGASPQTPGVCRIGPMGADAMPPGLRRQGRPNTSALRQEAPLTKSTAPVALQQSRILRMTPQGRAAGQGKPAPADLTARNRTGDPSGPSSEN